MAQQHKTQQHKTGVLLINLGTPQAPTCAAVARFLREFLLDPKVVDSPYWLRALLVYGLILPFRVSSTQAAYQAIWTSQGSPLLHHSEDFTAQLQVQLGQAYHVELGMRYGTPSLATALAALQRQCCNTLIIFPLFPQYAASSTGSAVAQAMHLLASQWVTGDIHIKTQFFQDARYIQALATVIQKHLQDEQPDIWLFSYHGLPERHIDKVPGHSQVACDKIKPCPIINADNQHCYRAQCFATSRLLAAALQLDSTQYRVAFQSRLGRLPWIKPYTDNLVAELAAQGHKKLAVVCPSFVTDCLETLEEVGLRLAQQWQAAGGTEFKLLPCLNSDPVWVQASADMILDMAG